jgi:hypothetical protein
VRILEFNPGYSVGNLIVQLLGVLEQGTEEKGGVQRLLADHFAKVYRSETLPIGMKREGSERMQGYSIHTHEGTLGRVWLNDNGELAMDGDTERMGELIESMFATPYGREMTPRQFLASLPQRLNNGYIWVIPEKVES